MGPVRTILVAVGALVSAAAVIAATEAVAHGLSTGSARFGAVAAGYALGALAGAGLASFFGAKRVAAAVPVLLGVFAAINFFSFPHPWWFAPLAVAALALGWAGGRWLSSRGRLASGSVR